jgi:hypothetical protein
LVEVAVATTLLVIGTLSAMMLGNSCSNLQQRIRDQNTAHRVACDLFEQMRSAGPTTVFAQYSASPTVTVQGVQATVTFPEAVSTANFAGMTNSAALGNGFLPVRINVDQGGRRYVFTTFLGAR